MCFCFPKQNKIFDFVSASKNIFRFLFPQLNISFHLQKQRLKICLLAETKTESIFTCGNKIKDFILLRKTKNIFSCLGKQLQIYLNLRKQSQRFYFAWENKKYFLFLGKTITETLLAETMLKIFFCL